MALLLEFTVDGPPVSYQTNDRANLQVWKNTVRIEAAKHWTSAPLLGPIKFVLMNFHEGASARLDDDNMAKPIRDALNGLVYQDDKQITHAEHSQTGLDAFYQIRSVSKVILEAFHRGNEFVYVRIEDAPAHTQLPR
jgi:crossover junction endodeoxyribonuclease RusA